MEGVPGIVPAARRVYAAEAARFETPSAHVLRAEDEHRDDERRDHDAERDEHDPRDGWLIALRGWFPHVGTLAPRLGGCAT
jgi:hypothetical protein